MPDGLRHLRNFAKVRRNDQLLSEIASFSKQPMDYSLITSALKNGCEAETYNGRMDQIKYAGLKVEKIYKDDFYKGLISEMAEITEKSKFMYT